MRLFLIFAILYGFYNEAYGKGSLDIDMKLKALNKPALKTIKSEDGDIIDCIDIYKQHAFDHPALKNHKIQEASLLAVGFNYIGAQAHINVWNPPRVEHSDYSSAQIWMTAGQTDIYETIEAGWVVNPKVFGDTRSRLFAYWTTDGYGKEGCFNLLCSGFVQTSTQLALGAAINPISTSSKKQYYIPIGIFLDTSSGNWWLLYGNIVLGYWPWTLLKDLRHSATAVQWGGEVYSPNVRKKPHTLTSMGSGDWADKLYGKACFFTNIRIKDYSLELKYPELLSEFSDENKCYSTFLYQEKDKLEPHFYFGGPGRNMDCL